MADIANIPALPQTVALEGSQIEGDPLEFMRAKAKENIELVEKNPIVNDHEKIEFKKYVLQELDEKIKKFAEIDKQVAAKKAEEQRAKDLDNAAKGGEPAEEDPFADIFKDDAEEPDEETKEKQKIAGEFVLLIKNYREKYLKDLIKANEHHSKKKEEEKLENILGKLNEI